MRGFLTLLSTAACAAGASGVAGTAPGLAAVQLLLLDENPPQPRESPARPARNRFEPTYRHRRAAGVLPCAAELQASLREVSISS